mgnify:FL=1
MRVIVVEDNVLFCNYICNFLQKADLDTVRTYRLAQAKKVIGTSVREDDIVLADLRLPDGESTTLLQWMRENGYMHPFIMMTNYEEIHSAVHTMKLGAEDYMVKPFEMLELLVRIEKVLERTGRAKKVLTVRNILVDMQSHQVYKDGLPVSLKPMEYDLFVLLLQNKNIALGREELLKRVWGEDYLGESRTVDVHIGQLRKKLELYDEIKTIPKLGYRLEE